MNRNTSRELVAGPVGQLEVAIDLPASAPRGLAVVAHPHPLFGGTLDNKVAQTLARAWVQLGYMSVRPNFRGVGRSQGSYDEGRGEVDDLQAVYAHFGAPLAAQLGVAQHEVPLALAGFSFGGFVAAQLASSLHRQGRAIGDLTLVSPAVVNFPTPALRAHDGAPLAARMLVVQGESDDVVPLDAVLAWARPQQLPILVVPGAGHFYHGLLTLLKSAVCTWHSAA